MIDTKPREVSEEELATLGNRRRRARLAARGAGRAELVVQDRADFLVTASHELRAPLAAVYGAAKLLERIDLADEQQRSRLLGVIAEESERLSTVVGDILTGAQLEAGAYDRA